MKLAAAGGERSTRLAHLLAVAKPTLTAIADGLVAAGYASRAAEPGDRRVVRLSLTPAGRAALDQADAAYTAWLGQLLAETGQPGQVLDALDLVAGRSPGRARPGGTGTGRNEDTNTHRQPRTSRLPGQEAGSATEARHRGARTGPDGPAAASNGPAPAARARQRPATARPKSATAGCAGWAGTAGATRAPSCWPWAAPWW